MNRAGQLIQNLSGELSYKSFKPNPLPPNPPLQISSSMVKKLVEANRALVRLDSASRLIPNALLFVSMYVRKEALISSQIEGTQCTLDDVLDPEVDTNINLDVGDVVNYVNAVNYAIERLKTLPLCNRLLKELHAKLLEGVRGSDKTPGEFRKSRNWIGAANCALEDARYIPPNVDDMQDSMDALEKYLNEGDDYDSLVRIALIHYQFETIHPFLDGNGRVGRLLILIYLLQTGILHQPVIYISYFLKKNQVEYYDRISEVRRSGNYEQWVEFFLESVEEAANDSLLTIQKLVKLHDTNIEKLPKSNRAKDNLRAIFDYIEQYPIIDIKRTAKALSLSYNTVASCVKKLEELSIVKETTNALRNKVYSYFDYMEILRKDVTK